MPHRCLLAALAVLIPLTLAAAEPKRLLLVGQGPDGHPSGTHEYMSGVERLAKLLEPTAGLRIEIVKADGDWPDGPEKIKAADGLVIFVSEGAKWVSADPRRHEAIAALAARGGGLMALHWALGARAVEPIQPYLKLFGGCHGGPDRKYQVVQTELRPADPAHPIASGIAPLVVREEFYYRLKFVDSDPPVAPVMQATIDGEPQTVAWAWQRPDGGRSFGFSGLHFDENWQQAEYQRLLKQAALWIMQLPIE